MTHWTITLDGREPRSSSGARATTLTLPTGSTTISAAAPARYTGSCWTGSEAAWRCICSTG
ncbi:MAG: hypothetical protein XD74_1654 [Actinobacteria bacterium 66_15]|nr:MAG: hypothetical protein XD74_1654 [Actinobacteria bacterium 66_15]